MKYKLKPIKLNFKGTPISDDTFIKQGWTKVEGEDNEYFEDHGEDDFDATFFPEDPEDEFMDDWEEMDEMGMLPYPNEGEWEDDYYFWVLPLPKDFPYDDHLHLISTTSDHKLPGFEKGHYIVELYMSGGLGTCTTEEEIEILYKAMTGEDIYMT